MTTTLSSYHFPKDKITVKQSASVTGGGHIFIETEEVEALEHPQSTAIVVSADALRDAIDKAVPPTRKPFDIETTLEECWERAEVGIPKEGDLLISADDGLGRSVWPSSTNYFTATDDIRIVKRAPKPDPVQVYVNEDDTTDVYYNYGPTPLYLSVKGHVTQSETQLIEDGYVPAKVSAA